MLRLILAACLYWLGAAGAGAAAPPACGEPLSLAFYELGALYYRLPGGGFAGIDKDVVEELSRRSGCRFHTVLESRVRIWTRLAQGSLDMSVSGIATPEREQFARFLPYFTTRNYVLLSKKLPEAAASFDGFLANPAYSVAVVKSFRHGPQYDPWIDKLRAAGRVHDAADFRGVLHLLKIGRVQAVLALPTSWVPVFEQEKLGESLRVLDWSPKDSVVHGLIVSRARVPAPTAERLARALASMREDGALQAIFARHVGPVLAAEMLKY